MSTPLVHSDVPDELNRLSFAVIGCAIEVHRALGPGQPERFYEAALCVALRKRGLAFERQKRIEVAFEGESIGTAVIDLVVEGRLIVEIKSVEEFHRSHEAQLRGYL